MDFATAIKTCFRKYVIFAGRASRSEFWYFYLFGVLVGLGAAVLDAALFGDNRVGALSAVANLVFFIPGWAVEVRRLHDVNRSGWWILIGLVPVIGGLVLLFWNCTRGYDPNRFGPNPLDPRSSTELGSAG